MIKPISQSTSNLVQADMPKNGHALGVANVSPAASVWDHLPAHSVFVRWVHQLRLAVSASHRPVVSTATGDVTREQCCGSAAADVWDLVGHGVVIEHTDPEEAAVLLPLVAEAAGLDYWEIAHDEVVGTFNDWKQLLSENVPTLIHLRAGLWVTDGNHPFDEVDLPSQSDDSSHDSSRLRAALAREMSLRLAGKPVVLVVAVRETKHVAHELIGARRFERSVAIAELDDATHGRVFIALGAGVDFDMTVVGHPAKVGAVIRRHDLRKRLDVAHALRRLVWQEGRPASLRDIIECDVHGTGEEDLGAISPAMQWAVAVHEAGHALVAYLASDRQHVPAYCSIGSRRETAGLVMPSYDLIQRSERGEDTYADKLHRLRILLAGRCAEHILLGPDQISAGGAGSDMETATRLATKMMGSFGLPVKAGDDADMAGNLLVIIGYPTDCEVRDSTDKARALLRAQYLHVLGLLRANHLLLLKLAQRLTMQSVLLQDDLRQIMDEAPEVACGVAGSIHTLLKVA